MPLLVEREDEEEINEATCTLLRTQGGRVINLEVAFPEMASAREEILYGLNLAESLRRKCRSLGGGYRHAAQEALRRAETEASYLRRRL